MYLHSLVLALNLIGLGFASLAAVNLRAVANLVASPSLRRAWRALTVVILCCVALQFAKMIINGLKEVGSGDVVSSVIDVLGPCFGMTVSWLSRRTALDMLRMDALEAAAFVDPLTGIANRRRFDERLANEVRRARAVGLPLSLLAVDIDHFKRVNDSYGHAVGDLVLKQVAALIAAKSRHLDTPCRVGGEEFVVIMPGLEAGFAAAAAERLRRAVAETGIPLDDGSELRATVSLGLAVLRPDETADTLFRRADAALYGAKRGGRDRMSLAA